MSANLLNTPEKTDKTDQTISNANFLDAIFDCEDQEKQPIVVSFSGSPQKIDKRVWSGFAWNSVRNDKYIHDLNNNYFTISSFAKDENGYYSRKKKCFSALHAIMLDDVGTKVSHDLITLPPSWAIETSAGNYQLGYILNTTITDPDIADHLMKAIIKAGLCDKGADGPTSRLARLPCAVNGKYDPPFLCKLSIWNPDRRYSVEDITNGFNLEIINTKKTKNKQRKVSNKDTSLSLSIISSLKENGLYKRELAERKIDITCPWVNQHTDCIDHGTAYFLPSTEHPLGGFNCLHGHCKEKTIKDLLSYLGIENNNHSRAHKRTIFMVAGEMNETIDEAEQALAESGDYYQTNGNITMIHKDPIINSENISVIDPVYLRVILSSVSNWQKYNALKGTYITVNPPQDYVAALSKAIIYKHLPYLHKLIYQPYLRDDGSIIQKNGYDEETKVYGIFNPKDFLIPEYPTDNEAYTALAFLEEIIEEFPFKRIEDKSATICAMLTASIRSSLPTAPMFHIRAPQISSGKSFLCRLITAFATKKLGTPTTFPKDEDECRKLLTAELMTGPAVIEFDNLTSDLMAYKNLCTILTSESITDRILGVSKTVSLSTRTLFLSSGNNVGPVQDMTRRCVTIDLDPACETPATKTYKRPNLLEHIQEHRGKYISAALTIIKWGILSDKDISNYQTLSSFSRWHTLCAKPLMLLGLPNPITSTLEAMNNDPDRNDIARLMVVWDSLFGKQGISVKDLVNHGSQNLELREVLIDIASDVRTGINNKSLGRWIKRHAGRIVNGKRFVTVDGNRNVIVWRLEEVKN